MQIIHRLLEYSCKFHAGCAILKAGKEGILVAFENLNTYAVCRNNKKYTTEKILQKCKRNWLSMILMFWKSLIYLLISITFLNFTIKLEPTEFIFIWWPYYFTEMNLNKNLAYSDSYGIILSSVRPQLSLQISLFSHLSSKNVFMIWGLAMPFLKLKTLLNVTVTGPTIVNKNVTDCPTIFTMIAVFLGMQN